MDQKTVSNFCLRLSHGFRKTQKIRAITSAWKLEESSSSKKTSSQILVHSTHYTPPNHLIPIRLATLGALFFGQGTWLSPNQTNHSPHPTVQENQDNVALGAPESTEARQPAAPLDRRKWSSEDVETGLCFDNLWVIFVGWRFWKLGTCNEEWRLKMVSWMIILGKPKIQILLANLKVTGPSFDLCLEIHMPSNLFTKCVQKGEFRCVFTKRWSFRGLSMEAQMDVNEGVQRFKVFPLLLAFAVPSAKVFFFITKVKHRRKLRGCTQFDIPSLKLIWYSKR